MHTKVDEEDRYKCFERFSDGGAQKAKSSRLRSRVVWLYYLGWRAYLQIVHITAGSGVLKCSFKLLRYLEAWGKQMPLADGSE